MNESFMNDRSLRRHGDSHYTITKFSQPHALSLPEMRGVNGATLSASLLHCITSVQMTRIMVYGTLKTGQPNYFRMVNTSNGNATFLGKARTVEKYPLVIAGKHNIPFLLNIPGEGQRVRGEIYEVDDKMLSFLDDFESCPTMYQRTPIKLELDNQGVTDESITEAFVYSTTTYQPDWTKLTTYENYDAYGDHGLIYVERENRTDSED